MTKDVLIILGSTSDQPYADAAVALLDQLGIGYTLTISSAHRHPEQTAKLAREAAGNGYKVIICMAGMAAHLPGVVAANTDLPVIGVPLPASLGGIDSVLAMTQMPPGIPVATVAIGQAGAKNSAVLAARILALGDGEIAQRHHRFRESL